jgi:uncharacterized damage-inducible protein DinB
MKLLLTALALTLPAFSQATVKEALVKHWKESGDFTVAVAKAMPAADYAFSPSAEEMSFGQLMAHIGAANIGACALASGMPRMTVPEKITQGLKDEKQKAVDKDLAVKFLADTFDFCNKAVASMTPEKLDAAAGTTRKMTGFEWLWAYFTHTAHHRGQAEVYLRVKGIKPPDYVF